MIIILIISGIIALFGLLFILDYLLTRFASYLEDVEIIGFQEKEFFGRKLPIVRREMIDENEVFEEQRINIKGIDNINYLLNPPIEKQMIRVALMKNGQSRVYGYLKLLIGIVLMLPPLAALGMQLGRLLLLNQILFLVVFIVVIFGGWVALKLIQRHY